MPEKKPKYYYRIADVPLVPLTDKVGTHFIAGQNILCSFIEQPPGATFPIHSHPAEQILVILEGSEEHICGDEKYTMKAGDVCVHPPNTPHGGAHPDRVQRHRHFLPAPGRLPCVDAESMVLLK